MPAIINPALKIIRFLEMHFFIRYKITDADNNKTAISHIGMAIFVRNSKGIPVIVIPTTLSRAIIPRQI